MWAAFERMSNQLPPRLKIVLNLAITATLVIVAVPMLWIGVSAVSWADASLGAGLLLLAVFNLFT